MATSKVEEPVEQTWQRHPDVERYAKAAEESAQDPNGTFVDHLKKRSKKG